MGDFIKNMISGASQADVALLMVPANKGGFETSIQKGNHKKGEVQGQTRQHARLIHLIGFKVKKIPFVPMSGFQGDNLIDASTNMDWYKGFEVKQKKKKIKEKTIQNACLRSLQNQRCW